MSLNSRFVLDALAVMDDDARVIFDVSSAEAPCKLTRGGEDGGATHVIMPMIQGN